MKLTQFWKELELIFLWYNISMKKSENYLY